MIDDLGDLYGVSMSENDSEIENLGTTSQNTAMKDPSTATQQIPSQPTVMCSPLSSTHSTEDSEFPDLDIPSVRENLTQSQPRLYTLSQNVDPAEIVSSSKGITTRKSRGVLKKSRAQLEWESQQKAEALLTKKAKDDKHQDGIEKRVKRKMKPRKEDVSQLIDDFSELGSSQ